MSTQNACYNSKENRILQLDGKIQLVISSIKLSNKKIDLIQKALLKRKNNEYLKDKLLREMAYKSKKIDEKRELINILKLIS